jgi:hypothetical protein
MPVIYTCTFYLGGSMLIVFFQVFGRGGEEMDFLQQQGIRVEVIPGIVSL